MYVNFDNLSGIRPLVVPFLLALKHASKKDVSNYINRFNFSEKDYEDLEKNSYISYIKGKKSQTPFQRMRLGKKGKDFLNSLSEPMVEDEDIKIFDWLSEIYKDKGKEVGNGKKTKLLISQFREQSEIEKNKLAFLCNTFINDENEQEYSHKLEYVFWKPKNVFQVKFILEDSRLWQYYQKNKQYFDEKFKTVK